MIFEINNNKINELLCSKWIIKQLKLICNLKDIQKFILLAGDKISVVYKSKYVVYDVST